MKQNKIGKKIKQFREFREISVEELALNANMDVTQLEQIEKQAILKALDQTQNQQRAPELLFAGLGQSRQAYGTVHR